MSAKRDMLDAEETAWRELGTRFDAVTPDAWERPGASGDWSPKDVLAHVASWHAWLTDAVEAWRVRGERPGEVDFDRFNVDFHERCRGMTVPEVRAMSAAARHRMREELAALDEEAAGKWSRAITTIGTHHYAEHIPDLDRFLEGA